MSKIVGKNSLLELFESLFISLDEEILKKIPLAFLKISPHSHLLQFNLDSSSALRQLPCHTASVIQLAQDVNEDSNLRTRRSILRRFPLNSGITYEKNRLSPFSLAFGDFGDVAAGPYPLE
jgi:hypothetical protein